MAWLEHTPKVLTNTATELVIEEPHFGRSSLIFTGIFLSSLFLIPAFLSGTLLGMVIGLVLGLFIVGVPFLIVLAISRYRRMQVVVGREIRSTAFNTFFSPRMRQFQWNDIAKIVYERRRDTHPQRIGRLRVTLHTISGERHRLLRGWFSEELKEILQQHFGEKYEYIESSRFW